MGIYQDKHGKEIKPGIYVSENKTYFKIEENPHNGRTYSSNLNPDIIDPLTEELAGKLTPLPAPDFEAKELRKTASWLEE